MIASKKKKLRTRYGHGGAREGSGRPKKSEKDKEIFGQITCVLRRDTIAKLRAGSGSRFFGEYLQLHLDRFPPPDRETYLALIHHQPIMVRIKRKKAPVIVSAGAANRVKRPPKPLSPELQAFKARYDAIDHDVS
jgi:hypothetical protein